MESEPKPTSEPGSINPSEALAPPNPEDLQIPYRDLALWEALKPVEFIKAADLFPAPNTETTEPLAPTAELATAPEQLAVAGLRKVSKNGFFNRLRNWQEKANKFENSEDVKVPDTKPNRGEQRRQRKQKFQRDLDLHLRELVAIEKAPGKVKPEAVHRAIPTSSREVRQLKRGHERFKAYTDAAFKELRKDKIDGTKWSRLNYEESWQTRKARETTAKAEAKVYRVARKAKA